jgi:HEPN domain-containing protein
MTHLLTSKKELFIYDCFLNIADCDYISARSNYFIGLYDQFLWSALQSVEKYLKSILLYFDKDTRELGHDLNNAIRDIESIQNIKWDFTHKQKEFLEYLTKYGSDRYFSSPRTLIGNELFQLDEIVWNTRKFCFDIPAMRQTNESELNEYLIKIISNEFKQKSNQFRLRIPGHLEIILNSDRFIKQRKILIWKNLYYGRNKKHRFQYKRIMMRKNPIHFIFPDIYPWVRDHVRLPKNIRDLFES